MSSNSNNKRARLQQVELLATTSTATGITGSSIASSLLSSPTTTTTASAVSYLCHPSIACSIVGFLTTREIGRLMLQTNKDMTRAFLGAMNVWNVLCESRWKDSNHTTAIRQHTGLSDKAIFRCFAYSFPTTTSAEDGQQPRQRPLLTIPTIVPPLQYTPQDYVMVMEVRLDGATDDKLLASFVLPGQEILDFFYDGDMPFLDLDEPTFFTTFHDRCETRDGDRQYTFPAENLPPFKMKAHLWRRGHEYVELFHSTNCIQHGWDFWSLDEEGDEATAVVCAYETTFTVQSAFPPLSDRLEQLLPLLNANDGIEFSTSLLYNVHYPRRRRRRLEQTSPAAAYDGEQEEESTSTPTTTNATIHIASVTISGKSGDFYLDQTFIDQEGDVEFAHLLEAMDWKDAV